MRSFGKTLPTKLLELWQDSVTKQSKLRNKLRLYITKKRPSSQCRTAFHKLNKGPYLESVAKTDVSGNRTGIVLSGLIV
jgi:hypothetical protein